MGYISDVVIAITKKGLLLDDLPSLLKESKYKTTNTAYYWEFLDTKWYLDYDEVAETMSFLEKLKNEEFGYVYVGEDSTDREFLGEPYNFDIHVNTYIEFPFYTRQEKSWTQK